jgi:hypothetical protein
MATTPRIDDIETLLPEAGQLLATATNDDADVGYVGEFATSTGSTVAGFSSGNLHSVSLAPGDYNVWGFVQYDPTGTDGTTHKHYNISMSLTTGTLSTPRNSIYMIGARSGYMTAATLRVSIAATTTVYLVGSIET